MQHHRHPPLAQRSSLLCLLPPLARRPPPLLLCCAARPCSTAAACLPRQRPYAVWYAGDEEAQQLRTCDSLVRAPRVRVPFNLACMRSAPASAPQLHHNTRLGYHCFKELPLTVPAPPHTSIWGRSASESPRTTRTGLKPNRE